MKKQDFRHHIRFYPPHHFVFYPLALVLITGCLVCVFQFPEKRLEWIALSGISLMITWLAFMMRQHYALTLQDRIVRLEMRLRYYQLTNQQADSIEQQLSFGQLAALRFASDEELPPLITRAVKEQLSPGQIKQLINNWVPDTMRV